MRVVCVTKPWLHTNKAKRIYLTVFTPDSLANHAERKREQLIKDEIYKFELRLLYTLYILELYNTTLACM